MWAPSRSMRVCAPGGPVTAREAMIRFAREALGLAGSAPMELTPLAARGSDRTFFRVSRGGGGTMILIHYDPKRIENGYYAGITSFLHDIGVPVPRLIRHDAADSLMLMEDIGNQDLWSFRDDSWEVRRTLYEKTLTVASRLHSFPVEAFPTDRVTLMEGFSPSLYRFERDYFRDHFVRAFCGIELPPLLAGELEAELLGLAGRLLKGKRSLVHRDLQSQNVMIRDGEPILIDYQGMRFGSPFYDLGSLLCDPYMRLSDRQIEKLLAFYYGIERWDMEWAPFCALFWDASAERLMQALGAYGFLGLTKGLSVFLGHIPQGLGNLLRAASHSRALPLLKELAESCQTALGASS
jgi:aminoglycoside/choline kinase family phosphotransferase